MRTSLALLALLCIHATSWAAKQSPEYFYAKVVGKVEVPAGYKAESKMDGADEYVLLKPATLKEFSAGQRIAESDFSRHRLIEIKALKKGGKPIVDAYPGARPNQSPGSLVDACQQRWYSLQEPQYSFASFDCRRGKGCSIPGLDWPQFTCEFIIGQPTRFWQIITESETHYFVLTSGVDLMDPLTTGPEFSLISMLRGSEERPEIMPRFEDTRPKAAPLPPTLRPDEGFVILWVALMVLLALFGIPIGPWRWRRSRGAVGAILLSHIFLAAGLLCAMTMNKIGIRQTQPPVFFAIALPFCVIPLGWLWRRVGPTNVAASVASVVVGFIPAIYIMAGSFSTERWPTLQVGADVTYVMLGYTGVLVGLLLGLTVRRKSDVAK